MTTKLVDHDNRADTGVLRQLFARENDTEVERECVGVNKRAVFFTL